MLLMVINISKQILLLLIIVSACSTNKPVGSDLNETIGDIELPMIYFYENSINYRFENSAMDNFKSTEDALFFIADFIERHQSLNFRINGGIGYNEDFALGELRASKVRNELIKIGVKRSRLSIHNCGISCVQFTMDEIKEAKTTEEQGAMNSYNYRVTVSTF